MLWDAQGGGVGVSGDRESKSFTAKDAKGAEEPETHANLCPSTRKPRVDGARVG
jgi:hypothetical protein